jgi:diguanylate cyclase (GGDEF)-like protein
METCENLLELCRRYGYPVSVIMLDIDHFKHINDNYGHPIGDRALRHISEMLTNSLRKSDFPGRYGGEEFAVILPQTGPSDALQVAEKIRHKVERSPIQISTEVILHLTLSAGVSGTDAATEGMILDDFLKRADDALYRAKRSGRNRIERFSETLKT